jgi:hypothetical protein
MLKLLLIILIILIVLLRGKIYNKKICSKNILQELNNNILNNTGNIVKEFSVKVSNNFISKNRYVYILNINQNKIKDHKFIDIIFNELNYNNKYKQYFKINYNNIRQIIIGEDIDRKIIKFYIIYTYKNNSTKIKCIEYNGNNYFLKKYYNIDKEACKKILKRINPKFLKFVEKQLFCDGFYIVKNNKENLHLSMYKSNIDFYLDDFIEERKGTIKNKDWNYLYNKYKNYKIYWINISKDGLTFYFR